MSHFPLFVELLGKSAVVVGAGVIAARRVGVLLSFGCAVTVVSPHLREAMEPYREQIRWVNRAYRPGDCAGAFLATAATNDRAVNQAVGEECRRLGVNDSIVHEDFMIGTADLSVDGIDRQGRVIPLFRQGSWAF